MPPADSASRAGAIPKAGGDRSSRTFDNRLSSSTFRASLTGLAILLCALAGAFFCGMTTPLGATITGLREGGWNWQYLPFVYGGWIGGGAIAIIGIIFCSIRDLGAPASGVTALLLPPALGLIFGAISFPLLAHSNRIQEQAAQQRLEASAKTYAELYEILRRDPEIALRERWYAIYDEHVRVFGDSLKDPTVPYSLQLLKRFYDEAPTTRDGIFAHPACDSTFLSEHFQEAYERAVSINYGMLASIVSNPDTPIELVEKVASSDSLPMGAVGPARTALEKRK